MKDSTGIWRGLTSIICQLDPAKQSNTKGRMLSFLITKCKSCVGKIEDFKPGYCQLTFTCPFHFKCLLIPANIARTLI